MLRSPRQPYPRSIPKKGVMSRIVTVYGIMGLAFFGVLAYISNYFAK